MSANVRASNRSLGVQALSRIDRSIGNKLATSVRMEIHRHELKYSLVLIDASNPSQRAREHTGSECGLLLRCSNSPIKRPGRLVSGLLVPIRRIDAVKFSQQRRPRQFTVPVG
jgi:hypothetical protein